MSHPDDSRDIKSSREPLVEKHCDNMPKWNLQSYLTAVLEGQRLWLSKTTFLLFWLIYEREFPSAVKILSSFRRKL
jgi:hypothetical protein